MIKLGIMKLGATITWSKTSISAANFDIQTIVRALNRTHEFEFTLISRKTSRTVKPPRAIWHDILSDKEPMVDALLIFNGHVNFYGGSEAPDQIMNYKIINKFKGPIIYINTDGELFLTQVWPSIHKRTWAHHWKESDLVIEREDIKILTQGHDLDKCFNKYKKKSKVPLLRENMEYYPLAAALLIDKFKLPTREKKYDLIYGGAPRTSIRRRALKHFYIGAKNLKVHLFGGVNRKNMDFGTETNEHVSFSGKIQNQIFRYKISEGNCSLVIGDQFYWNNFITLRFYETLLAGTILLIHNKFDPDHLFFNTPDMSVAYIKTLDKMQNIILDVRNRGIQEEVAYHQRHIVIDSFDVDQYCTGLADKVKLLINSV